MHTPQHHPQVTLTQYPSNTLDHQPCRQRGVGCTVPPTPLLPRHVSHRPTALRSHHCSGGSRLPPPWPHQPLPAAHSPRHCHPPQRRFVPGALPCGSSLCRGGSYGQACPLLGAARRPVQILPGLCRKDGLVNGMDKEAVTAHMRFRLGALEAHTHHVYPCWGVPFQPQDSSTHFQFIAMLNSAMYRSDLGDDAGAYEVRSSCAQSEHTQSPTDHVRVSVRCHVAGWTHSRCITGCHYDGRHWTCHQAVRHSSTLVTSAPRGVLRVGLGSALAMCVRVVTCSSPCPYACRQGDEERSLGLPLSPLCDRTTEAPLPVSQLGTAAPPRACLPCCAP